MPAHTHRQSGQRRIVKGTLPIAPLVAADRVMPSGRNRGSTLGARIESAVVDTRLIPLNGVVALLRNDPSWASCLAEQGFRLHLIEADVQSTPAVVRADVIFYRRDPDLIVLCECKSGGNVVPRQARSYVAAEFEGLRQRGTAPDLPLETPVTTIFAGLEEHREALAESLAREQIEAPLLTIGSGAASLTGSVTGRLEDFDVHHEGWGLPPMRFRVDMDSPLDELKELLIPQIVAAQARGEQFLDLNSVGARLLPDWPALGTQARRRLVDQLKIAGRKLARDGMRGDIEVESANNIQPRIVLLRRIGDVDPRGAPQAWQAQSRRAARALGRGETAQAEGQKQMSLDDLDKETISPG